MATINLTDRVTEHVDSHRRVSKPIGDIRKDVTTILTVVDQVNALGEYETKLGDTPLSEVRLPDWVRPFIYPVKVAIMPGYRYKDLVLRPDKDPGFKYNEGEVTRAAQRIAANLKKEDLKLLSPTELGRKEVAMLSSVNFSLAGKVFQKDDSLFVPVPLVNAVESLFDDDWSNATVEEILTLYFLRSFEI